MDYSKLRAAALQGGEDEEAVTVDTRALIDKVLARYSGEWTTLRELIQNAADAQATTVSVKWETLPSTQVPTPNTTSRSETLKHVLSNHTLRRLVVQNDGQPFTKTDWGRLKRIAEGNPDETKIGAFGVGFYSVFADCEEPFVSSGSEAMAFYWKGNALFTKKTQLPEDQASRYTAFVLDYRNATTPMPNLLSVSQFLATSLTFVALQNIEFWIDDYQILSLKKKSSPSLSLSLPRDLEARTKEGLMTVTGADVTSTQVDASYMNVIGWKPKPAASASRNIDPYAANEAAPSLRSFFARLTSTATQSTAKAKAQREETAAQAVIAEDVTKSSSSTIFLRATSAAIKTSVSTTFAAELERATKKPPPKTTKLSILTSTYDETQASEASNPNGAVDKVTDVFASVLPSKKPGGRIFIGFPTMQTTGAGMHVSAPSVIPTVEREAIDLNARWVRSWNQEILRATGIIARLAFAKEMDDLNQRLQRATGDGKIIPELIRQFLPEAIHILQTYSFNDSTPSGQVAQLIEEAFWTSFKKASIEMYSSAGVLQTSKIRLGTADVAKFVDNIPIVLSELQDLPFTRKLIDFGLLTPVNVTDVKQELESKALDKAQLIHFISWAAKRSLTGELDPGSKAALLEVAVAEVSDEGSSGEIIALGAISNFLSISRIPKNLPIPPSTIPYAFTSSLSPAELNALGWETLELVPWLRFLLDTSSSRPEAESLTRSPKFAVQILTVLSKNWDTMNSTSKEAVLTMLQSNTVMPTKLGMRKPSDSFFPSVKLFDDLPVIQGCDKIKDKFLTALSVRKTLDLETIFTRLLHASDDKGQSKWSHKELVTYLASVQNDIPADDLKKLRETRFCPAEAGPKGAEPTQPSQTRYKVSDLFEPKDSLRLLHLPILQWPGPPGSYRASSPEARFLSMLGLRPFPSVPELVEMMASPDESLRTSAMTYFVANHQSNRYASFDMHECKKTILPLQGSKQLVQPSACFTNQAAAVLGYNILRSDLHDHANKFGVARDPPMVDCVNKLIANPPKDQATAITLFGYFASRMAELGGNNLAKLKDSPIVPVTRRASEKSSLAVSYVSPIRTYLGSSPEYGDIFDFVDFGQHANSFLFHCGAKSEPTKLEIAHLACNEPARLLGVLQSPEKYLSLLKTLAEATSTLHRDKELWRKMKTSSFLLAYKELAQPKGHDQDLEEDDAPIRQYQLSGANRIVVVDDIISYRLFKEHLRCAPEDDVLEDFYLRLGAEKLSSLVQEDVRIGPASSRPEKSQAMKKHIVERSKIFLHEYAHYRRDAVKRDAKWLGDNLRVEMVKSVALRRTLKGHTQSHTEKRSAASSHERSVWTLYVADSSATDMYQVGQAVCQMLLNRPNQQAYLFFEPFLTLDLYGLRARGYNVDRILRAKAAQARIAEEERRKALDEEQQRIREMEKQWGQQNKASDQLPQAAEAAREAPRSHETSSSVMPGSWESPEDSKADKAQRRSKSIFSNLSRRLGFDSHEDPHSESEKQLEQAVETPTQGTSSAPGPRDSTKPSKDDGKVTSPAVVQQNLLNAIQNTRAHGSNEVQSQARVNEVKEQGTYCDQTPAHNITFAAEASNGMKVFVSKDMRTDPAEFLSANSSAINAFASLLVQVGQVYSLSPKVLHIFNDEASNTIAFNLNGSIFCNVRFFLQLHAAAIKGPNSGEAKAEASTWWFVTIAHELAHNLIKVHNSDHSYYTESFVQQYIAKMMALALNLKAGGGIEQGPSTQGLASRPRVTGQDPPPPYT